MRLSHLSAAMLATKGRTHNTCTMTEVSHGRGRDRRRSWCGRADRGMVWPENDDLRPTRSRR